jgi:glutathione synthase/RimK-type ligase-like ATP-grasp enzyme
MVDKNMNNAYIWYSTATDVTGKKLAEALGMKHGDKKPIVKDTSMVIGWGTKTKEAVSIPGIPILNHPDRIALNRNKLASLKLMLDAGVNVAPFIDAAHANSIGAKGYTVFLPVIGRTSFHQGGKGFWNCPTPTHVKAAVAEGAGYFQNLIEIDSEFRLHTLGDKVIYAVKKTKRTTEEMEEAFVKQEGERQNAIAAKNGDVLDAKTMEVLLRRQAKKFAQDGANMLIRSNRMGWKFVRVKTIDKALEEQAVKALKAIGLDFGAVDCCIDAAGKPWIIEVNSGPGLEETTFDVWVEAFRTSITSILQPPPPNKVTMPKGAVIDIPKVAKGKEPAAATGKKQDLIERVKLMSDLAAVADEEEASVLGNLFKKMFS